MKGTFFIAIVACLVVLTAAKITDPYKDTVTCTALGFMECWTDCSSYNNGIPNCCDTKWESWLSVSFECTCKALSIGTGTREPSSVKDLLSTQIGCGITSAAGFWGGILKGPGKAEAVSTQLTAPAPTSA